MTFGGAFQRIRFSIFAIHRRRRDQSGLTLIELMIVLAIMGILAALAVTFLWKTRQAAKAITLRHDLKSFAVIQDAYFAENNEFIGDIGDSIRNDDTPSDFTLPSFLPSKGVAITIVSGDPEDPYNEIDPLVVESRYSGSAMVFEYNFRDQKIIEK